MMLNSSKLKFIRYVGLICIVLFLSNVYASPPSNKSEAIDYWTDSHFYTLRPKMRNRKIQKHEWLYKQEWQAIQNVVSANLFWGVLCEQEPMPGYLDGSDSNKLADAVFYTRHPELKGRKIRSNETLLKEEWNEIKTAFSHTIFYMCD